MTFSKTFAWSLLLGCGLWSSRPMAVRADPLEAGFVAPPDATKPRCYWYWMNGQISKEGITRDLEAMRHVGIGEAYIGMIDGQSKGPINPDLVALSDPWWDDIAHAVREGSRIGVDIGFFNAPGWSQSGGPWVKPAQAMRHVVLPETHVHGPAHCSAKLATPAGSFQDIAVLAFPAPAGEADAPGKETRTATEVTIVMPTPIVARSVTVEPSRAVEVSAELSASDDGEGWRSITRFDVDRHRLALNVGPVPLAPIVVSIPPTPGRFFKVTFSTSCTVGAVRVSSASRVDHHWEKQLDKVFQSPQPPFDFYTWPAPAEPDAAGLVVPVAAVLNLSDHMGRDGTLRWDVPPGDWVVLRAGMMPTGTENSPAPAAATGLEVDKMNRAALAAHFDAYVGHLLRMLPPAQRTSWKHVVADSYETGPENWTDGFAESFKARYGYDPLPWLPVMTGRMVGSAGQSDRFLWDLRRLVADRVAHDYVGGLHDLCSKNGLRMWLENYGHWGFPAEFLQYGGACDEISGEFWATGTLGSVELRDASSSAHTYGKPIVWAEAFTGGPPFQNSPRDLKARGDWAFCQGINQYMLHLYIHQPDEKGPGMNAPFGTEFNRNNTWFAQSQPWIDYVRRCSFMLQQGLHVADVAYFIGEDTPKMTGIRQPALPLGYDFDYINAEVLLGRATVVDGRLTLPDGMSYRMLVLPPGETMRPELLRKIAAFVDAGLPVFGPLPTRSPSLQDYPAADAEIRRIAATLAGRVPHGDDLAPSVKVEPDIAGLPGEHVLFTHRHSADADIYFLSNQTNGPMTFTPTFRTAGGACELWHPVTGAIERVDAQPAGAGMSVKLKFGPHGSVFVVFRATSTRAVARAVTPDRAVEIRRATYSAIDGHGSADVTAKLAAQVENGELRSAATTDALGDDPAPNRAKQLSVEYTVGGKPMSASFREGDAVRLTSDVELPGPWTVDFPNRKVKLDALASWADRPEPAIKYFSGTATYHATFTPSNVRPTVTLDLGRVDSMAEVIVNGHAFPTLWIAPYEVDVTSAIKPGVNHLNVRVVNVWHNRLLGEQLQVAGLEPPAVSVSTPVDYGKDEKLYSAGLLGPVTLRGADVSR